MAECVRDFLADKRTTACVTRCLHGVNNTVTFDKEPKIYWIGWIFLLRFGAAGIFRWVEFMEFLLLIDSSACISCGMCAERLPGIFRIDRTARCAVIVRRPRPEEQDDALEAAEDCPAGAIISSFFSWKIPKSMLK